MKKRLLFVLPLCALALVSCGEKTEAAEPAAFETALKNSVSFTNDIESGKNAKIDLSLKISGSGNSITYKTSVVTDVNYINYKIDSSLSSKIQISDAGTVSTSVTSTIIGIDKDGVYAHNKATINGEKNETKTKIDYVELEDSYEGTLTGDYFDPETVTNPKEGAIESLSAFIEEFTDLKCEISTSGDNFTYKVASADNSNSMKIGFGTYNGFNYIKSLDVKQSMTANDRTTTMEIKATYKSTSSTVSAPKDAADYTKVTL